MIWEFGEYTDRDKDKKISINISISISRIDITDKTIVESRPISFEAVDWGREKELCEYSKRMSERTNKLKWSFVFIGTYVYM